MVNRRRFLSIAATCAVMGSMPVRLALAASTPAVVPTVWKGSAMGALASMTLVHPDRTYAQSMIARCVAEIDRLESVFSLYRPDSALSRLNAAGELAEPPSELVELLSFSLSLAERSKGAFDPTVQPLLSLYFEHFATPGGSPAGPSAAAIAQARQRIGFADVEVDPRRIRLGRPGAAITLNGVAQGFVTDRVAELLLANGFGNVLIDLGEGRALGRRADGQPWRAAVADPARPDRTLFELTLGSDQGQSPALATSGGYGTRFGTDPLVHHLLDPHSGRSANHYGSVSVAAPRATLADGLSTTLSIVPPADRSALLADYPRARAWFVDNAGRVTGPDGERVIQA
ncbi:FAD:protein FMN transferase [Novilysobacter antarcticus]|uniref:FAD:protein FMN transferase n=1 Tax=Novilysobacter antarcticus TaxID=2862543 RepID=UPI001C991947|nr:FAD:protein FMN transferase [Lysobacter antarcticus]